MTQKEYVNIERAMQELRARQDFALKERRMLAILPFAPFLIYIFVFIALLNASDDIISNVILWIIMGLLLALPAYHLIRYAVGKKKSQARLQEIQPIVVRSKLGSKHEQELVKHEGVHPIPLRRRQTVFSYIEDDPREYKRGYWYDWFVLYFPEGRFVAPFKTFTWSKDYGMTGKGLFLYAQPGDEFYLLIGQSLQGKPKREVLLACPTKLFRWEESEISESGDSQE